MNYTYYSNFNPDQLTGMLFHLDDMLRDEYSGYEINLGVIQCLEVAKGNHS